MPRHACDLALFPALRYLTPRYGIGPIPFRYRQRGDRQMPLPMPEEEELHRCPHGERCQALMLCSLDCATSGAHPDRKTKADGRFIVTPWWCIHKCKWFSEHKNEVPKKP